MIETSSRLSEVVFKFIPVVDGETLKKSLEAVPTNYKDDIEVFSGKTTSQIEVCLLFSRFDCYSVA